MEKMKTINVAGPLLVAVVLTTSFWAMADENVPLNKLPAAVQTTLKQIAGNNKLEGCDAEVANGKATYEADFKVKGSDCSVTLNEAGDVLERVLDAPLNIVPTMVLEAAQKAHPGGKFGESEIHNKDGRLFYVLEVHAGADTFDVSLDAGGKVIADEKDMD